MIDGFIEGLRYVLGGYLILCYIAAALGVGVFVVGVTKLAWGYFVTGKYR